MEEQRWTSEIVPKTGRFKINLREIWQYKDLIKMFVKRDITTYYKQTVLGGAWFILNPLLTTTVFTVIFGIIANISTEGVPSFLFYMLGNTVWVLCSTCITNISNTFLRYSGMMGKVYFPRLTVPIATMIFAVITFFVQFAVFLLMWLFYWMNGTIQPTMAVLLAPLLILHIGILGFGLGIIVSSLTTKYRDLQMLVAFGVNLLMYLSPVVYSLASIPERLRRLYLLNPLAPVLEMFRYAFFGTGTADFGAYFVSLAVTLVIVFFGVTTFNKVEKTFMDTI